MTQRTQVNDEPAQQIDEKWVEYGTQSGGQTLPLTGSSNFGSGGGSGTTRYGEKSVAFSDDLTSTSSSRYKEPQIEFLAPANSTTILSKWILISRRFNFVCYRVGCRMNLISKQR